MTFLNVCLCCQQMSKRSSSEGTPLKSSLTPESKKPDVRATPASRVSGRTSKHYQDVLKKLLKDNFTYHEGNLRPIHKCYIWTIDFTNEI